MIQLFNPPQAKIDTSKYSNLLHDKIVRQFEEEFAAYIGAKHVVSFNSASSAIFLLFKYFFSDEIINVPSIIPPVVPNMLINAGCEVDFIDNERWVGSEYTLHETGGIKIIDSAQRVDKNQFLFSNCEYMIFSFYPTKPVGSCDGGLIACKSKARADELREASMNGMTFAMNNWERKINSVGWKMYMNSVQADIALRSLQTLEQRKDRLAKVRDVYNSAFGLENSSHHLYRVRTSDNKSFIEKAKVAGIVCGIHYDSLYDHSLYTPLLDIDWDEFEKSRLDAKTMVSIPFHDALTDKEINTVIQFVNENR